MFLDGVPLRDLEGRPQSVRSARRVAVGRSYDDVARERVLTKQEVESGVELVGSDLPCDERAGRETRGHEGLSHAPDGASGKHGAETLDDGIDVEAGLVGDLGDRVGE